MTQIVRFSSAALGMVLLAGLAYYQGHPELDPGDVEMMSGTVLAESAAETSAKDCESMAGGDSQATEFCVEKGRSSGTN